MEFFLSEETQLPPYVQLKEQILQAISRGDIKPGDQLPTVREVAVNLTINPNTVSRAYADLEREGMLSTQRGKGTFVIAKRRAAGHRVATARVHDIAQRALGEIKALGFRPQELLAAIAAAAEQDPL